MEEMFTDCKCIVSLGANELQGFQCLLFTGQIKRLESVLEVISGFSQVYILDVFCKGSLKAFQGHSQPHELLVNAFSCFLIVAFACRYH